MVVLGLLAAVLLGLMALHGVMLLFTPDSPDTFFFPLPVAIPLASAFGLAATYGLGRLLGLVGLRDLRDYEARRRIRREIPKRPGGRAAVPESTIEY